MKKVSLLLLLVVLACGAMAQAPANNEPGRKTTFVTNNFWDDWFFGVGIGSNWYIDKSLNDGDLFKKPTMTVNGQVGKWFSPYLGLRGQGTFGSLHSFNGTATEMAHQKLITVQVNALFDVTNYFMAYTPDRFYNFIIFGGAGGGAGWDAKLHGKGMGAKKRFLTVNAGIINKFKVAEALSVDVEIGASAVPSDLKRFGSSHRYNGLINASIGATYNFGNSANSPAAQLAAAEGKTGKSYGFAVAGSAVNVKLDQLNDEMNRLRQRNAILEKRPEFCPECPKLPAVKPTVETASFVSNVVFFRLNSSVIDASQQVSIYNTAEYMKANPNAKVRIVGYADKDTGTATYNEKISERRAKVVADVLIKNYGIASNRVSVEWKGSSVQPYPQQNAWNRVAIFYAD